MDNLELVRRYFAALESNAAIADFFTDDALQVELPNLLNRNGATSDLATLRARAERGSQLLSSQRYDILAMLAEGDRVAVETRWSATLAVPFGSLAAGATMSAHFAVFFECVNGRIRRQRNYDCFDPF